MRVYLPSTLPLLAAARAAREIAPAPLAVHAVTPALREWYVGGDLEELEYAAMTAAARACLRLLAADPSAPRRRVVLAAEMPDQMVTWRGDSAERSLSELTAAVPWKKIASAHLDDTAAVPDVAAAVEALPAADAGDDDALFVVDGAEGHELLWYATQELPHLH